MLTSGIMQLYLKMKTSSAILTLILLSGCTAVQERLAIKECKFAFVSVRPYDFAFSDMKLDFVLKADNPNSINALLDKLAYKFFVNNTEVFSGATGQQVSIPAKKSKEIMTTITLQYNQIGLALVEAMKLQSAAYRLSARAYVNTVLGEISYPVDIELD